MRTFIIVTLTLTLGWAPLGSRRAAAQTARQTSPSTLQLTVDEAVRMALGSNLDLAADRLDPAIGDTQVAAAAASFKPTISTSVQRNNQLQPPSNLIFPIPTRTDVVTSNVGLNQRLPWFGTSYSVAWDSSHTDSNAIINAFNPLVRSGLSLNVSQPLLRDLKVDAARIQLTTSRLNRNVAGTRLRESEVRTSASVKAAYWNLVSAQATVEARRTALQLAEELARVNKAKVDVGQSPPLDLVSAQAEVASNQEQLIIAETAVRQAEDRLRLLIFDTTDRDVWNVALQPIDSPPVGTVALDVDAAIATALRDRSDLVRARIGVSTADAVASFSGNQRLPDVRINASYQASGLGGTEILRSGGFPGTIVGTGTVTTFGSVLNQLIRSDYPTWALGVSVSYPIGESSQEATWARSKLERAQAEARVKSAEGRVIQQLREAAWKVEMNAKRVETSRAVASLAEQRLDAERKRFEVGMSTSFLVIQAQRDFVQGRTNELAAILAYDLALVDFEALQQAPPAGQTNGSSQATTPALAAVPATPPGATRTGGTTSATGIPGL
ncbi:MAG: TolC family protein [Vicinamibacterales bacterium]